MEWFFFMNNLVVYKQYNKQLNKAIGKELKRLAYIKYEHLLKEQSRAIYKANNPSSNIRTNMSVEDAWSIDRYLSSDIEYKMAKNKKMALRQQKKRFNLRIKKMAFLSYVGMKANLSKKYYLYFVTLTFDEDTLKDTSKDTRHTYISRFLKDNAFYYIANIDYGTKNDREHYHAIVLLDEDQKNALSVIPNNVKGYNCSNYNYGFSFYEPVLIPELLFNDDLATFENIIFNTDDTSCKIATYMNKLTNHAYKDSTEMKLIYSRNKALMISNFYYTLKSINAIKIGRELFGADLDII